MKTQLNVPVNKTSALIMYNYLYHKLINEFNDIKTRNEVKTIIVPKALKLIHRYNGLYDIRCVCDETNNPPSIIDNNELVILIVFADNGIYSGYELTINAVNPKIKLIKGNIK